MQIQKDEYKQFIVAIKLKIQSSQIKASIKVNVELLKLYWDIAVMIVEKQKGFSVTNIKYMRNWYLFCFEKSPQFVDEIFKILWGQRIDSPLSVNKYELAHVLPNEFKSSLPSIESEFEGKL